MRKIKRNPETKRKNEKGKVKKGKFLLSSHRSGFQRILESFSVYELIEEGNQSGAEMLVLNGVVSLLRLDVPVHIT